MAEYAITGTPSCPAPSSARRIAPICPSIIPEGAITSAPASAATTTWRARFSSVASFSTCASPAAWPITPQWPWSVYSQKQLSVITTRSGAASLAARVMRASRPLGSSVSRPAASLLWLMPNSITARTPSRATASISRASLVSGMRDTPGISAIGTGASIPSSMNSGRIRSLAVTAVSRTKERSASVRRRRRRRVVGNIGPHGIRPRDTPRGAPALSPGRRRFG